MKSILKKIPGVNKIYQILKNIFNMQVIDKESFNQQVQKVLVNQYIESVKKKDITL
jgi:uncharacterized membrane protein